MPPAGACLRQAPSRRKRQRTKAHGKDSSAEEAAQTVARCLDLVSERHMDALLEFVPDAVLDRCIERKKHRSRQG
jgi:hypothetical protein